MSRYFTCQSSFNRTKRYWNIGKQIESRRKELLLIVPRGIEIKNQFPYLERDNKLLIVPRGIEMLMLVSLSVTLLSFNRTKRYWNIPWALLKTTQMELLIVPRGIEILSSFIALDCLKLLIVPRGIEILPVRESSWSVCLLIVPRGIEILQRTLSYGLTWYF